MPPLHLRTPGRLSRQGSSRRAPHAAGQHLGGSWVDVTRPLVAGMPVWPGDPPVSVERVLAHERGDPCQVSALSMSVHAGTHVDAPCHYAAGAAGVEAMPASAGIGPARLVAVAGPFPLSAEALSPWRAGRGQRLLLRTDGTPTAGDQGVLSLTAARRLAARRVALVGTDAMSIGPAGEEGDEVHRVLLGAGVWILEGLDLTSVPPGRYDLVCAPLLLPGADGAPARVFLRPRRGR